MKVLILAVVLTLVGCQQQNQQTEINRNKVFSYDYEFEVQNRIPGKGFASAGIKVKCKVDIAQIDPDRKLVQAHSFVVFDYNGIYPWQRFIPSSKLTELFEREVKDVITFQHRNGHVEDIMAPAHISEFAFNIYKGILNLFEYTLKIDQKNYNLRENGIEGKCNTTYVLRNTEKNDEILVTKSKDLNDCDNMVLKVVGATYTIPCKLCKQTNKNFQATATYNYKFKNTQKREKPLLEANSLEIRQFTPFEELNGGNALMEASQKIVFIGSQERLPRVPSDLKKYGSLPYKFKDELPPLPVQLLRIKNREREIEDGLQYLAGHSDARFPADGTIKFLQLVQLLRTADETDYFDSFFKRYSNQPAYRRVILDLIPAVGNPEAIRFLRHKMEHGELTSFEISQTLLVFLHFCNASQEVVEEAMIIVTEVLRGPDSVHRRAITLAYGSLLNRYCSASDVCSDKYLKPLIDFATNAAQSSDEEGIVLVIKAYGNVGHPAVLKPLMKFIPNSASPLNSRIRYNAILALRNLGKKDPTRVQGVTLQLILNYKIDASVRVLAAMVLLETKPALPVLMTLTNAMLNEPSMQVENFVYTYLRGMARSTALDLKVMASASRVALKVLSRKIQQSAGYRFSRVFFLGVFRESVMAGVGARLVLIHKDGSIFPMYVMAKLKANFLGHIFLPLEVGIAGERASDILERVYASGKDASQFTNPQDLLQALSDQKTFSGSLSGGYLKIFDQEIMYAPLKIDMIREILQAYQGRTFPVIKEFVDFLKNHNTVQWDKNFMSAEIHRVVPTCTGLPWQISLVHISNTKVVGNAQLSMTPEPTSQFTLPDMINTNIKLKTKLNLSIFKDMFLTMGVLTPEIQAVLEENANLAVNIPVNLDVTVDIKEKNLRVELPPCKQETDIISLRFKTSAITRNIEEAPASKSTPVLLPETMSNIMKQSFDSSSAEQDRRKDAPSSEIQSAEKIYSQKQSERHLDSIRQTMCFEACTFGCKACLESSNAYVGCILGDSLYNIVGEHLLKLTLKPDETKAPIEKLRFTIQGGTHAAAEKVPLLRNEEMELRVKKKKGRSTSSESSPESSSSSGSWPQELVKVKKLKEAENEQEQQEDDQEQSGEKRQRLSSAELGSSSSSSSSSQQQRTSTKGSSRSRSESSPQTTSSSSESSSRSSPSSLSRSSSPSSSDNSRSSGDSSSSENSPQSSDSSGSRSSPQSSSESSSNRRSKQHAKERYEKDQDKKRGKTQSSDHKRPSDEDKHSKRPLTKYLDKKRERQSWDDLSPPRVRGLQWSIFSFKEIRPNQQEQSSSSSSSSESGSSSSSDTRSRRNSSSDSSMSQQTEDNGDELLPYFTVVAQALRSDNKDQGYKFSMYMNCEIYKIHIKMVATELEKNKWRACFDSQVLPYKFQNYVSWGNECRDYRIDTKVSRGQVARHAALQMNMKWTKLPAFFSEQASWAMESLPGIAYMSGFLAVHQKNPSRELMLRMVATSPYTTAMTVKIPGETFYKDGLYCPFILPVFPAAYHQAPQITTFNILDLASWLAKGDQAVCEVGEERIVTFDDKIFNTTLKNQDCDLLIVQDCNKNASYVPAFRLWTRKSNPKLPREIHLKLKPVYVKILPTLDTILVLCNDKPLLVDKLLYEDAAAKINIYKDNTTVAIEAPAYGLVNVTYNRTELRVTVASRMKGNTCGLCGDNNGEKRNEGLMPNQEVALSDIDFIRSWSSADNCVTEAEPTSSDSEKTAAA